MDYNKIWILTDKLKLTVSGSYGTREHFFAFNGQLILKLHVTARILWFLSVLPLNRVFQLWTELEHRLWTELELQSNSVKFECSLLVVQKHWFLYAVSTIRPWRCQVAAVGRRLL